MMRDFNQASGPWQTAQARETRNLDEHFTSLNSQDSGMISKMVGTCLEQADNTLKMQKYK